MNGRKTVIAVNIASLLFVVGPLGPVIAWIIARVFGYEGIQVLPIRGWKWPWINLIPKSFVVAINGHPWNYGTLKQVLERHKMEREGIRVTPDNEPPLIYDWVFFGESAYQINLRKKDMRKRFEDVVFISHEMGNEVFEVNPEAMLKFVPKHGTYDEFKAGLMSGCFAVDPYHLVRIDYYGLGYKITTDARYFASIVDPNSICAIHVNPNGDLEDFEKFLAGEESAMGEFLDILAHKVLQRDEELSPVPVVVEAPPKYLIKLSLGKIRERVVEAFEVTRK